MNTSPLFSAALLFASAPAAFAQAPSASPKAAPAKPDPAAAMREFLAEAPPTAADVAYGKHPKQVLHFWKADSPTPTPLIFFIHGGAWTSGDRAKVGAKTVKQALADGISVVSVEYRFIAEARADGVVPPVKGPMLDCARALQFVRSKAGEWNLDKNRVGAGGGSAGACTSLWLAFHEDLADPASPDPIARESTRLTCAAVTYPQTSLDPAQMRAWTPNSTYGGHAFGVKGNFDAFLAARESLLPWIKEYSPIELVTTDDPPVGLYYPTLPNLGKPEKDPTHSANFGVKLKERCDAAKVACEFVHPGIKNTPHPETYAFLRDHLKNPPGK